MTTVRAPQGWPDDGPATVPRDWRDTLSAASDLALLGIATALAALPVVTAGAAVAAASAATHDWCRSGRLPAARVSAQRLRRGLLPGAGATAAGGVGGLLLLLNAAAVARGSVPGGIPLLAVTIAVSALIAGFGALVVVEVGRAGGTGWLAAAGRAWVAASVRPSIALALGGVVALAGFLGLILPVCVPLLVGYLLFALHVVVRRLPPPSVDLGHRADDLG